MSTQLLLQVLKKEEGRRLEPYRDSEGLWTVGYGHLIDRRKGGSLPRWIQPSFPLTEDEVDELLVKDAAEVQLALGHSLVLLARLNDVRRVVLLAMAFQLGVVGVLKFTRTLAAIDESRWDDASASLLNSLWARQTPARAQRMAEAMRTGDAAAFQLT